MHDLFLLLITQEQHSPPRSRSLSAPEPSITPLAELVAKRVTPVLKYALE